MSNNQKVGLRYAKIGERLAGNQIKGAIIESHRRGPSAAIGAFERKAQKHGKRYTSSLTDAEVDALLEQDTPE